MPKSLIRAKGGNIPMKTIISLYGKVALIKKFCEVCKVYAFVIDGVFRCCGKKDKVDYIENCNKKYKRESLGTGVRGYVRKQERDAILKYQNNKCVYCECDLRKTSIHFDHFVPFSFTYTGHVDGDLVASCSDCNRIKNNNMFFTPLGAAAYVKKRSAALKKKRENRRRVLPCVPE